MHFEEQIRAFSMAAPSVETCGLVMRTDRGDLDATTTPNLHPQPGKFFAISPQVFLEAKNTGRLVGYWHSHPTRDETPSEADRIIADEFALPSWIFGVQTGLLRCYVPAGFRQPLEGRAFIPMVNDCVSLVWDYFRDVLAIELPFLPREQSHYNRGLPFDFRPFIASVKATVVLEARRHDVLLMALNGAKKPNHLGIYIGDGHMIHQLGNHPSERTVYGGYWAKSTVLIFRHPDAPAVAETRPTGQTFAAIVAP